MGSKTVVADAPHAVCIPFPAQSHIMAMLKFAKILHRKVSPLLKNSEFLSLFFAISACSAMGCMQFASLRDKGFTPLKDASYFTNGYLDTVIDWIPAEGASKASGVVIQTFDALEREVLDALSPMFPHLYAIGPLQLLLNQSLDDPLKSIGCGLWKEDTECLHWLNSKAPNSVVYVNFGSLVVMTAEQLADLVEGESAVLPSEFLEETKDRGLIASWCPQEEVLNHPAVGGFLTHCGWNSIIESVSAGVPMLCWPSFGDQQTNCKYACKEWGIGMEIDSEVKREEVEKLVKELMVGEKGKRMKKKTMEWKKLAEEATGPSGSSSTNLQNLVNEVLLSKG
ncbi:UDP-glycosyltransferase 85A3 [Morella rubra]|uniref:UDP-glycosyltransferase 85A3 n=1 Tax=Morella rubra TaxID=262757 RepID=A0A6A1W6M9_9ROSI|nr:UDP-glycosyltransferase 85A3 [Morella rubra]